MELSNSIAADQPAHPLLLPVVMDRLLDLYECNEILELAEHYSAERGRVGNVISDYRKTVIQHIELDDRSAALYDKLHALVREINDQHFGFDIRGGILRPECITYVPDFGHFGWHTDINYKGSEVRKLTVVIQLSPSTDYEGGELQVFNSEVETLDQRQGAVVAFPAFSPHQVTPVTRGVRRSLVVWAVGPRWR